MGKQDSLIRLDPKKAEHQKEKAKNHRTRFLSLPETTQASIETLFRQKQLALFAPVTVKLKEAFALIWQIPILELMWILLSLVLPILFLLEKNKKGFWILPLVTLAYALNNQMHGHDPLLTTEKGLYPQNFSGSNEDWHNYLATNWSPEGNGEEGEFYFNLARLDFLSTSLSAPFWEKRSILLLSLYLLWNLSIAINVLLCYHNKREDSYG